MKECENRLVVVRPFWPRVRSSVDGNDSGIVIGEKVCGNGMAEQCRFRIADEV
jgi:hypothetical protein